MQKIGLSVLVLTLTVSFAGVAVTPQFWENFTQKDLLEGTLTRISLSWDGKLFLAPAYELFYDTKEPFIFSMVRDKAGNTYLGTGHTGKVFKVNQEGKGSLYFQAKELDIFALALDKSDALYVGTSPDGKVYKVTGPDQSAEFCAPEDKYIWSLLFDEAGNLYVGTGGRGLIHKVDRGGQKTTLFVPDDSHVTSLALGSDNDLLAGTSPGGMVLRINTQGKAFTLLDTPMEEIRALAKDHFGTIYAVATSSNVPAAPKSDSLTPTIRAGEPLPIRTIQSMAALESQSTQPETSITIPGGSKDTAGSKSSIYAISKEGSAETLYTSKEQMVYDLQVRPDNTILASTGPKGRLLTIDSSKRVTVVTDSPEEQITRLVGGENDVWAAGSNQGRVYKLQAQPAESGVYLSKALDAKVVSSWGRISWRFESSDGETLEITTRSGNTEKPDRTWSEWSSPYASGDQVLSPMARYFQWRAALKKAPDSSRGAGASLLERIKIPYLQHNLRPQVVSITILPSGISLQKPPSLATSAVSLNAASATRNGLSLNSPRIRGKEKQTLAPRRLIRAGAQSFTWKATDDNDDSLEYSIYFRGGGETDWKLLKEKISDTFYTLDSASLPDGVYTIKVVASDAPSNAYGKFLIGELVSKPFVISNSTPIVEITEQEVRGKKVEVKFRAKIPTGRIESAEFSIDGGDWLLLFPIDGIADSPEESFQFATPELTVGEHLIGLRASDINGNTGTAKLVASIP